MTSTFTTADYAGAALALRPQGRAWPDDPDAVQVQAITALVGPLQRVDEAAIGLLADAFPATTDALLPDWEASLGLPDPCAGELATTAQRRSQVVSRFIGGGGQSADHFVAYAAILGFTVAVARYAPFRVGFNRVGDPLYSDDWAFAWSVHVTANVGGLTSDVLKCEMQAIAPAETTFFIS